MWQSRVRSLRDAAVALAGPTLTLVSVLCVYVAFVTFDREVACFWTAKRTGASLLFFANRWISLTVYVLGLVQLASLPSDKVSASTSACLADGILPEIEVGV